MNNQIFGRRGATAAIYWYIFFSIYVLVKRAPIYFLNLGYYDETINSPETDDTINKIIPNETSKRQALLYKKLFRLADIQPSSCLEIACGLGGGTYLAKKYFQAADVCGIDINPLAIYRARRHLKAEGLTYQRLHFLNMPALHRQFDLIFLLEASFHFESLKVFFDLVWQNLNDSGIFLYGDLFETCQIDKLHQVIKNTGFRLCASENITEGVVRSIEQQIPTSGVLRWLEEVILFPRNLDFRSGSYYYEKLKRGEISYWLFAWKKCP